MTDTPVVAVVGPRQSGKTTLCRQVADKHELPEINLDDSLMLDQAVRRPESLLGRFPQGAFIDEVQRAPALLRAIKARVDRDRKPGQYLLTGSTNLMALPKLGDSLAGRMEVIKLWPLSWQELGETDSAAAIVAEEPWPVRAAEQLWAGGFPEPVQRRQASRRRAWFENYLRTILERDVRELAQIAGLVDLPRLLRAVASGTGDIQNVSSLSRETGIPATTVTRYLTLFDAIFLTFEVPALDLGLSAKASKTGKRYLNDPALMASVCRWDPARVEEEPNAAAKLWETAVAGELLKRCHAHPEAPVLSHFRSIRRFTVPFVITFASGERQALACAASAEASPGDVEGLEFLRELDPRVTWGGVATTSGVTRIF